MSLHHPYLCTVATFSQLQHAILWDIALNCLQKRKKDQIGTKPSFPNHKSNQKVREFLDKRVGYTGRGPR